MAMTRHQAVTAIAAILDALPDKVLPRPDKIEYRDGDEIVWFGDQGHHLGKAVSRKYGEETRKPLIHRSHGIDDLLIREKVYRLDQDWLPTEGGDQ